MMGKGSLTHNRRAFKAKNVKEDYTQYNIEYCNENIKAVYHELFVKALERYNEKQTRNDRKIDDYYEKIRTSKQEKLFHEVIFQIGNKDDMSAQSENGELAKKILDEFMKNFQQRNPNLKVFSAHLHMDEETPHLHEAPLSIPAAGENLDVRKLQPALCECLLLIRQYNTAAREAFGSVRRFLGGQCGAETNEIQHAIDTFDFEKAESGLLHLAQLLDLELREPNGLS